MHGQMMHMPLIISTLLTHAERHHGDQEIVSRRVEGDIHKYTYRDMASRARQLANALNKLKIKQSDRVSTLAWNGYRHLELYYAVSGMGAILHTINPRLHVDQIEYIINHAEDQVLFFDLTFTATIEEIVRRNKVNCIFVALCSRKDMPTSTGIPSLLCYEEFIENESDDLIWPSFDEEIASSLCYTSGTTGNPKGVLYSHRATILHALSVALPDSMNCSATDSILPVVPMFHVNAWGLPYIACMVGAKLVLPGPRLDGKSLYELFETESVTMSAGVPTVWFGLLEYLRTSGNKLSSLHRLIIGGAACPPSMIDEFQDNYGVRVFHAWGMTEMSPVGGVCVFKRKHFNLPKSDRLSLQAKQGRTLYGVDMRITDDAGNEISWGDSSVGNLQVKGPWVISKYFGDEGNAPLIDGWFPTGDVANIDSDGFMKITDRSKDVIKSGGEWIGSLDIENFALMHPAVAMAACIGVSHKKWDQRPLLIVVKKPDIEVTRDELLEFISSKVAKWWTPDDVIFVNALPIGATGKLLKARLREEYKDYLISKV